MNPFENAIYLDHAATTPLDSEVAAAMMPYLVSPLSAGNPSSVHRFGREARAAVDDARDVVAQLLSADYSEIYFTGSGTEADNLALIGTLLAAPSHRRHVVTTTIEHHAVLHSLHFLETLGYSATYVPVDAYGRVDPNDIKSAITHETTLVSVMHANNEIGTLQPIREIADIAHEHGALLHTDAVQTAGAVPISVRELGCDLLSLCAHKMYGPKGAGALYIRQGVKVSPILHGGAQEREKRAGTENVAALVGFGRAAQLAKQRIETDAPHITALRDLLLLLLREKVEGLHLNGHPTLRLPNNLNVSVEGTEGSTLLMNLDFEGVAAASGAACSSGSIEPSHVLDALGLPRDLAANGVRFSLGRTTTEEEVRRVAELFAQIIQRLRRV